MVAGCQVHLSFILGIQNYSSTYYNVTRCLNPWFILLIKKSVVMEILYAKYLKPTMLYGEYKGASLRFV